MKERKFKKHYEREQGKQAKQCNLTNQVKKTKQKEEKYKNNTKIKDVKNMKKIIVQIYNNLQVLWNSKVKFVSLSHLLGWPVFGSDSGSFTAPGFIVLLKGIQTKKERKKRKKGRRGEKKPPAGFKLAKPDMLFFLAAAVCFPPFLWFWGFGGQV